MTDTEETCRALSTKQTSLLKAVGVALPLLVGLWSIIFFSQIDCSALSVAGFAFPILVTFWLGSLFLRLSRVSADEKGIEVRAFWTATRFEYGEVKNMTSHPALSLGITVLPLVTLTVQKGRMPPRKIRFIARCRLKGWVGGEHPDVRFLRAKVGFPMLTR